MAQIGGALKRRKPKEPFGKGNQKVTRSIVSPIKGAKQRKQHQYHQSTKQPTNQTMQATKQRTNRPSRPASRQAGKQTNKGPTHKHKVPGYMIHDQLKMSKQTCMNFRACFMSFFTCGCPSSGKKRPSAKASSAGPVLVGRKCSANTPGPFPHEHSSGSAFRNPVFHARTLMCSNHRIRRNPFANEPPNLRLASR